MDAESIIHDFELEPLPHEGGWFRRIYTDDEQIPAGVKGPACGLSSIIYYLITVEGYSAMHRLVRSNETFHWHAGDPMEQLILHPNGKGEKITLGNDFSRGHQPMSIIPRGCWQGARLADETSYHGYAFMTVVVTPEFWWEDFVLGDAEVLAEEYPAWKEEILRLSR